MPVPARALALVLLLCATLAACDDGEPDPIEQPTDAIADADAATGDTAGADTTAVDTTAADTTTGDTIEVLGTWQTQFDTTEVIAADAWAWMALIEFDNSANVAITQNAADDMFNPDAFNRLVWTEPGAEGFAYCIVAFGLATLEEARASTATADANDLETGCGGFAWTLMTP